MSEVNGTAVKWREWIDAHRAVHSAAQEAPQTVNEARNQVEAARRPIQHLAGKAWHSTLFPADLDGLAMRGDEDAQNARSAMRLESEADYDAAASYLLGTTNRATSQPGWRKADDQRRAFVAGIHDGLRTASANLKEAEQALADAERHHEALSTDLGEIEKQRPKASHSSMKALAAEIERSEADCQRIEDAIASMDDDGSAHSLAQNELAEAQQRLDDLGADAALGDANKDAQRAATNAIAAARKKSETAQQDAARQTSARRGLERRLDATRAQVDELTAIKNEVARHVYETEMAAAESALLKHLSQDAIQPLVERLNEARDSLDAVAQEGTSYRRAELEIRLPILYGPQGGASHERITF